MRRLRLFALLSIGVLLTGIAILLTLPALAQDENPALPRPITPGVPLRDRGPTVAPDACFKPLAITIGQQIFVKPGVNIRDQPNQSSPILWNTIYNNYVTPTPPGEVAPGDQPIVREPVLNYPAVVVDGPVCSQGFNWWRVEGFDLPGWVAEGRPDEDGYFLIVPGVTTTGCAFQYDIAVGDTVIPVLDAKVRTEPSPDGRVKTVAQSGSPVLVLAGSECVDDFRWWFVRVTVVGVVYEGWVAEGSNDAVLRYYLLPDDLPSTADGTLCAAPLDFAPGDRGYINYIGQTPKALRAAPDTDAELLVSLVEGVPFVIEGGPVCADNLNFWRIRVLATNDVIGWIAEGSPRAGYWLFRVEEDELPRGGGPPPQYTPPTRPPGGFPTPQNR